MAELDERKVLDFLVSWLASQGGISEATLGEPLSAPVDHVHGAVQFRGIEVEQVTLTHAIEQWNVALLVYFNAMAANPEETEYELTHMARVLLRSLFSDIDLNDLPNVRSIEPVETNLNAGFQQIQQKWFRTLEIIVGITVDDSTVMT